MITDQAAETWDRDLDHVFTTTGHHFGRVEPRRRLRDYWIPHLGERFSAMVELVAGRAQVCEVEGRPRHTYLGMLMTRTSPRAGRLAGSVACAFILAGTLTSAAVAQPAGSDSTARAAASNCLRDQVATTHFWCNNRAGIRVEWDGETVGYLNSTTNWFTCRYEGDLTGGGGPHPRRWIYTLADSPHRAHGGWGFVKDSEVYDETNPLPPC